MKVVKQRFIGYQDIFEPERIVSQARSVCIVEPYGDFTHDPDDGEVTEIKLIDPNGDFTHDPDDGEVTEIKLIDPKDFKKYFNWGVVGDRLMERSLEIKAQIELELNYVV